MTEWPGKGRGNAWGHILLSVPKGRLKPNSQLIPFPITMCCLLLVSPFWKKKKKMETNKTPNGLNSIRNWYLNEYASFPPLGELRVVGSEFYALHLPINNPNLLVLGQDLAPSLAGSFVSSSFCGPSGSHTGHDWPAMNCSSKGMYPFCSNDQYNHSWIWVTTCLGTQLFSRGSSGCKDMLFSS